MKQISKKLLLLVFLLAAVFTLCAVVFFLIEGQTRLTASLLAASVVAGVLFPVFTWLVFRKPGKKPFKAYELEESDLNEEELTEAVRLWVFAHRDKRVEGDLRFLEDEDGSVRCRVTVRKED